MDHFIKKGMREGRRSSPYFSAYDYKLINPDLRSMFGNNAYEYYFHYITKGKDEKRIANFFDVE